MYVLLNFKNVGYNSLRYFTTLKYITTTAISSVPLLVHATMSLPLETVTSEMISGCK